MIRYLRSILRLGYNYFVPLQDKGAKNTVSFSKSKFRGKVNIFIYGSNNRIMIDDSCILNNVTLYIWGNDNVLSLEKDVKIQKGMLMLYNGAQLWIGHNTTFQEVSIILDRRNCEIGVDCMFSEGIKIRNYDGHKIIDKENGSVKNAPGDIIIGKHVWVGQDVTILKNTIIHDGAIIGCKALVSGEIDGDSIACGIPARTIKKNTTWIRH